MTTSIRAAGSDRLSSATLTAAYYLLGAWALYLLLAPTTGFSWIESWHNEQRAVQIVLLVLTALLTAVLTVFARDEVRARLQFPVWWWVFVALGVVSALASQVPFAAFAEVALFVLLSTLVTLTATLTAWRPERMTQAARYGALLIAGAHVLSVLVRYGASLDVGKGMDLSVFMLGYANPRFASALYAVLMPFVAAVATDTRERRLLRAVAFTALCALWTINLGLGTRGIWFAYLVAVPLVSLVFGIRSIVRIVGVIATAAAVGLALFLTITAASPSEVGTSGSLAVPTERLQSLTSREVLWGLSWDAITANPLLGLGPMHFAALQSHVGAHPHNWPLQMASEWGLPALATLLFVLIRALLRARSGLLSETPGGINAALAMAVALAYGLVDGNLVMPVSQTAVALIIGLTLGSFTALPGPRQFFGWREAANLTLAIASAVVIVSYSVPSLEDQARTKLIFRTDYPGEWLTPRFWEQGLLFQ